MLFLSFSLALLGVAVTGDTVDTGEIPFEESFKQGKERVCLYEEWEFPVESITSPEQLFSLLPSRSTQSSKGAENNILLSIFEDACEKDAHNPMFIGAQYQTGPGMLHLASMNKNVYPQIVTDLGLPHNCSLFVWINVGSFYQDSQSFRACPDSEYSAFANWIKERRRVGVPVTNNYGKKVKYYWYENDPTFLGEMVPGQVRNEQTFLGHVFFAADAEDDMLIDFYVVSGPTPISIQDTGYCGERGISKRKQCSKAMWKELKEWAFEFWARKREALNFIQPRIVKNFTATGYKPHRLPDNVYGPIKKFWDDSVSNNRLKEENHAGPVLNQQISPTFMTHLPDRERRLLQNYLRPLLEEWAGVQSGLFLTSLYGIRKYTRGAILAMHVDTCRTHVISAIINVDSRLDDGKDWPLQIYDHSDTLHEFSMKPGDVMFYESARSGHARFKPLPGEYYANIFIHFRPNDSDEWEYDWF